MDITAGRMKSRSGGPGVAEAGPGSQPQGLAGAALAALRHVQQERRRVDVGERRKLGNIHTRRDRHVAGEALQARCKNKVLVGANAKLIQSPKVRAISGFPIVNLTYLAVETKSGTHKMCTHCTV